MSIGEALAQARRQAGLTVAEVSQRTRIRETIIAGIEADDYAASGGDFYARGHIRAIARVVGIDSGPLIEEYDAARLGPPDSAEEETSPLRPVRTGEHRSRNKIAAGWLGLAILAVVIGFAADRFLASPGHPAAAAPAQSHPATRHHHHPAGHHHASPASRPTQATTTPAAPPATALVPASASAFGPAGGQGDDPAAAHLVIGRSPAAGWHTDWYTTARFGNLYGGTGLLVDMGRPVTLTAAQIRLGSARGADLQLRIGDAPALADLRPAASAADAGGVLRLHLAAPVRGRYVLIWFTSLPPDPAGTFQASVYSVQLEGGP
jgi:cytoskeletal protein RodZ